MTQVDELYEKNVRCPICDRQFKTKKVRISRLKLIKRDTDFLSHYEGENPLKYNIFVCPHCGYAAREDRYASIKDKHRKVILKEISSKWGGKDYGNSRTIHEATETYKLAIYIGQLLDYKKIELGLSSLNIAWLYRIEKNLEEERRFLKLSKIFLEEGYYNESLENTNMDQLRLCYLLGEISRRLEEREEALKWFNITLSNTKLKHKPIIEKMAREQWQLTRNI